MLEKIRGLYKSQSYVDHRSYFEELHQINLQRVGILSLFISGSNLLSLLFCAYQCYFNQTNYAASAHLAAVHFSGLLFYLALYFYTTRNVSSSRYVVKGRWAVWLFTGFSLIFIGFLTLLNQYSEVVPSVGLTIFCGILIIFYRNKLDLLLTFFLGLAVNIFAFSNTISDMAIYSGQIVNLLVFGSIFLLVTRYLYYYKIKELENVRELNSKKSELVNVENTLASINKNILQGLFRMDHQGNLVYANEFLVNLFGYHSAEEMAFHWNQQEILLNNELQQIRDTIEQKGLVKDMEIRYVRNDGTVFWGLINCTKTRDGDSTYFDGTIIDNTERKSNEKILENLSLVASKTDNAVFIIDKEEKIEWVNEAFEKITGYSFQDALGKKPGILFQGENTNPETILLLGERINRGESFSGELLNYRKDGSELWVHFTLNPILNEKKEIEKYVAVESDITERKNVELELIKAKEEAEMLMKVKDQFLSMVSHELRTPLNAIIGMTHLMFQERPADDQHLKTIKTSSEYLLALINDILDFSKIEAGKIAIEQANFSFSNLVQMLEQTFYYQAQEKNIRFTIDVSPDVPNALMGDPVRLNQILVNLIGNSIKFTDYGYVKLTVKCLSNDDNQYHLQFLVTDTGIGIPQDKIQTIFERFEQVIDKNKRGGTGLGLAITKNLVEMMGGTIKVESELGIGSEFTFDLYFSEGDEKLLDDVASTSYNIIDNMEDLRILLVEDNKINQMVAAKFLNQWKVKYDIADNGSKAIKSAMMHKYDIVLMDLQMPEMDGMTATREIRKLPGYHYVPIIALTAASLEAKDEVYKAGMNDFLIKPFNPVELYNKIKKFALTDQFISHNDAELCGQVELDLSGIQKISDGDSQFLLQLLYMCVDQFKKLPNQLMEAMKEKNMLEAGNIIHKISPSIKMLQYYQLEKTTLEFHELIKENKHPEDLEKKAEELIEIINKIEMLLVEKAKELNSKLIN